MEKIKDRLTLGIVSGFCGNIAKLIISEYAKKRNWAEIDGPERAAGMLIQPFKISTTQGKIIGWSADTIVASMLGVSTVYMLSITGKDKAIFKGIASGSIMWNALYGVLATMGASKVSPVAPRTVITQFIGHIFYGGISAYIATKLGDPRLFNGEIPLIPNKKSQEQLEMSAIPSAAPNSSTPAATGKRGLTLAFSHQSKR